MAQGSLLRGPTGPLQARLRLPGSKSLSNRALIACAGAGVGDARGLLNAQDIQLLAQALQAAGWRLDLEGGELSCHGFEGGTGEAPRLDLGNSGTGSRLLIGLLASTPGSAVVVDGSERLRSRPMAQLFDGLRLLGADLEELGEKGFLPVLVRGRGLQGGDLRFSPGPSSQFVSSLLLAAPSMLDGLELELVGEIPSRPYLDLTVDILVAAGVDVEVDGPRYSVRPGWRQPMIEVEADWSAAAFFLCAIAISGGEIRLDGLDGNSRQGDRILLDILVGAGAIDTSGEGWIGLKGPIDSPLDADLRDAPDTFPALSVVAATRRGSVLRGLEHLQHKECDRLTVMCDHLNRLGAETRNDGSVFSVHRSLPSADTSPPIEDFELCVAEDHRIAMALAVAALRRGPFRIDDPRAVSKSLPGFWRLWNELLGGG